MSGFKQFELPEDKQRLNRRAVRLEWLTIAYLVSAITALGLVLSNSQAMKAAWIEDILSLLPPLAFLVASRLRTRPPSERFPWGHHRAPGIGYLAASVALLVFGAFIFFDSAMKLVTMEHPPIGTVVLFGEQFWLGWLMIAALLYSAIPAVLLGRAKIGIAKELHDKVLYADAEMNRADWLTAAAAIVGVIGIGLGLWFTDALAGMLISLDITRDGWRNLRRAVSDLADARPATVDSQDAHPLNARAEEAVRALPWVRDATVRLREAGHVFTGEALVVPVDDHDLVARVQEAGRALTSLDWKLQDVVVSPVPDVRPTSPPASRPRPAPR